jgi:hypothetical protein
VTTRTLVPLPVRRYFRHLSSDYSVLRLISAMFENQGFVASGDPNDENGQLILPAKAGAIVGEF